MKKAIELLHEYIPSEFIESVQEWNVQEYVRYMQTEHKLYFDTRANSLANLAWWNSETPWMTETDFASGFGDCSDVLKNKLKAEFPESLVIIFLFHNRYNFEKNLLCIQVSSEMFFTREMIFNEKLSHFFETEFIFIADPLFTKWMIPHTRFMMLDRLIANFPVTEFSVRPERKPWQAYFSKLDIPGLEISIDLFDWHSDFKGDREISGILSKCENHLRNFYNKINSVSGAQPEAVYNALSDCANDEDYNDIRFVDIYGVERSLAWILKDAVNNWYITYHDDFSDGDDPDNILSRNALECYNGIREVSD